MQGGYYFVDDKAFKIPSRGSADKKFAIWAAEASKPSQSSGPFSDSSLTSNPDARCLYDYISVSCQSNILFMS